MERDGRLSVFGVHWAVAALYSQMPPWAAPRMNWPLLGRIASAPMRPLIAVKPPLPRVCCTIGFGPSAAQAVVNVAGPGTGAPFFRRIRRSVRGSGAHRTGLLVAQRIVTGGAS